MKKMFFTSIFIIMSQFIFAQIFIGGSAGLNATRFNIQHENKNDGSSTKYINGLNIEVPVLFKFNKNIGIQSGIGYYNMGSKIYPNFTSYNVIDQNDPIYQSLLNTNYTYRLNYLSAPLTFNVFLPINKFSIYARAGMYASYLIQGKIKENSSQNQNTFDIKKEDIKQFDFGTVIGIGASRNIGNGYIFLDAKYMIGLNNINNPNSRLFYMYNNTQKINNRDVSINIGYMFRISKNE